jgi:hypothetical protein
MYPRDTVELAKLLSDLEILDRENATICGVSIAAVRHWRQGSRRMPRPAAAGEMPRPAAAGEIARCPRCHARALDERAYGYLLGLYLGDGHITHGRRDVCALSIKCCVCPRAVSFRRLSDHQPVRRALKDGDRWYEYPRYLLSIGPPTYTGCAARRWTGWRWPGGSRSRPPSRSRGGRPCPGSTSSSARSTDQARDHPRRLAPPPPKC